MDTVRGAMDRTVALIACLGLAACNDANAAAPPPPAPAVAAAVVPAKPAPKQRQQKRQKARLAKPAASEPSPAPAAEPAEPACPDDMALVEGDHCRSVEQTCLEYHKSSKGVEDENRCLRFAPTRCTSTAPEPRKMRYCMDRYEYPNRKGEIPVTLVSWKDAQRVCEDRGKRLCTESEFTFACEGEEMRPYATGFQREPDKCNIDKPYQTPKRHMLPWARCEANAACSAEMKRVDGRVPSGSLAECVSPFGIHDLEGNVNEWVSQPWKRPGKRAALKGGWWGPVRNRCRAITMAHGETYMGYEVGFRCCADAR